MEVGRDKVEIKKEQEKGGGTRGDKVDIIKERNRWEQEEEGRKNGQQIGGGETRCVRKNR